MLPTFPGLVTVEPVDPEDLRVVWLEEADEGVSDNQLYFVIAEVTWSEVQAAIDGERELIALAKAQATTDDDFDSVADQLVEDRYTGDWDDDGLIDDGPLARFYPLDLGVMSAVAALVAGYALTTTSCRGHHSRRGEPKPLIRFICDDTRLPLIAAAATNAGCGMRLDSGNMLQLYGPDIDAITRFAEEMVSQRPRFDGLPADSAFESRTSYGDYLDDYEAYTDFADLTRADLARIRQMMKAGRPMEGQLRIFENE
ncbi:hypothetical protein I0C86_20845 [Plantactinospora sp. S1510]|uniref:DUF4375 domain-containing protein n=1 Tax=Plantactinospora alkalitolerans TaxID=2789879 RepID=A0ABS0GYT7_9ACTN|nr:hypothetical protein [Plantactinospora alkalitolerans]MBF9131391.1 hypothetical protein [Plantactinospora alkalitolerans]